MSHHRQPLVSVIVVAYDAARYLSLCLGALRQQTYQNIEILLIDTTPYDSQTAAIARQFSEVTLIAATKNLGYAGGNNLGFAHAHGEYIAILNPDTEPDSSWLGALVMALEDCPMAGLATSKIVLFDQRWQINTCGNEVHYTGLATCRGLGQPSNTYTDSALVPAVSGAAFLIRRELFARLGGFDERFFMYLEDTDLSWRAGLQGYSCLFVPTSIVAHHYTTRITPTKLFYLERNRYLMLLQNFQWWTLLLLVPALVLTEITTWGFAVLHRKHHLHAKVRACVWIVRHPRLIHTTRRRVQRIRLKSDAYIIRQFGYRLPIEQVSSNVVALPVRFLVEPLFRLWQHLILFLCTRRESS